MPDTSTILGIDFGERKVGLALADTETKMAFAYTTLANGHKLLAEISRIAKEKNVGMVVVGLPSHVNREEVDYPSEKFGRRLEKELRLPVEFQNEMFTTKLARYNLATKGVKGLDRLDDQEAARIILQSWLDRQK